MREIDVKSMVFRASLGAHIQMHYNDKPEARKRAEKTIRVIDDLYRFIKSASEDGLDNKKAGAVIKSAVRQRDSLLHLVNNELLYEGTEKDPSWWAIRGVEVITGYVDLIHSMESKAADKETLSSSNTPQI